MSNTFKKPSKFTQSAPVAKAVPSVLSIKVVSLCLFCVWLTATVCFSLYSQTMPSAQQRSIQLKSSQLNSSQLKNAQDKMMDHSHLPIDVPSQAKPLALSLSLAKDAMSGVNLTITTEHYHFALPPSEMTMQAMMSPAYHPISGFLAGHAHLYINGDKVQRLYGQHVHLPDRFFKQGINTISVTLNNHGHMQWQQKQKAVVSTLYVNSEALDKVTHQFDSFPVIQR